MGLITDLRNRIFNRYSESIHTQQNTYQKYTNKLTFKNTNPELTYKKGMKVLQDSQVSMGYQILKNLLQSKKYNISSNDDDTEVLTFIEDMFKDMDTEITDILGYLLTGILWGFSANEQMFDINPDGKLIVKDIIPIHIKTLQDQPFTYNDDGDLVSIHQTVPNGDDIEIPINKVLLYSYNDFFGEPQGNGVLKKLYPITQQKLDLNDWWLTFMERHASPTLIGKSDNITSREEMLDGFDDIAAGVNGMAVGINEDITSIESNKNGEAFETILNFKNNEIYRIFFIGDLLMSSNATGSYAQSNTQLKFTFSIYDGILEEIANCIQKQIINPIVQLNFGEDKLPPVFSFDKFTTGDLKALFEVVKPLIDTGVVDSENSAVHEALALLFRSEAGVEYSNTLEPLTEDYWLPSTPENAQTTEEILSNLEGVDGGTLTEDILNEVT